MSRRRIRGRSRRNSLVIGVLILVGVLVMVVVSATGQRPFGVPSEEAEPEQQEEVVPLVTDPGDEEAKDVMPPL